MSPVTPHPSLSTVCLFFFWLLLVPRVYCKLDQHHRQLAAEACKRRWWKFLSKESGFACRIANNQEILSLRFLTLVLCISKANQVAGFFLAGGEGGMKCFKLFAFVLIYHSFWFSLPPFLFLTAQPCHDTVLERMSSVHTALKLP